jgi:hypothetical protein
MLKTIFNKLNNWIDLENKESRREGLKLFKSCTFRVVGQTALLEAKLDLEIAATTDVDAFTDGEAMVVSKFNEFLKQDGLEYDQLSNEIWMPEETTYSQIYKGPWVTALLAEPEFILVSKAKMSPKKNLPLIRAFIASEPRPSFFELCEKHNVDLASILKV